MDASFTFQWEEPMPGSSKLMNRSLNTSSFPFLSAER
jgi:hypothetical protein